MMRAPSSDESTSRRERPNRRETESTASASRSSRPRRSAAGPPAQPVNSGTSRGEPRHQVGNGAPGAWKKSTLRSARVSQNGSRKRSRALTTAPVRTQASASRLRRSGGSKRTPSSAARAHPLVVGYALDPHERRGRREEALDIVPRQLALGAIEPRGRQPAQRRSGAARLRQLAQHGAELARDVAQLAAERRHLPPVHLVQLQLRPPQLIVRPPVHELGPQLDHAPQLAVLDAVHAAADAVARLHHQDPHALAQQLGARAEARGACAEDERLDHGCPEVPRSSCCARRSSAKIRSASGTLRIARPQAGVSRQRASASRGSRSRACRRTGSRSSGALRSVGTTPSESTPPPAWKLSNAPPVASTASRESRASIDTTSHPKPRSGAHSVLPQQWTPTAAPSRRSASTTTRNSWRLTRCCGSRRSKAYRPGSSRNTTGRAPVSRSRRARASARASTRRKICRSIAFPSGAAARGSPWVVRSAHRKVNGPAICTLAKGGLRCSTSHRNGRNACQAPAEGRKRCTPSSCSRARSRRASSVAAPRRQSPRSRSALPSASARSPCSPSRACGTMYSAASRRGSCGAAGMSRSSACCSASSSCVCGRLPMPLVASAGSTGSATRPARDAEVGRVRVVEDDRGDARLRIHHAAVGQLDPDVLGAQHAEEDLLVLEARTRGIAEREPLAPVVRLEAIDHRRLERIRETPLAAQVRVQELRIALRRLQRERLEEVALEEVAVLLVRLGAPPDAGAGGGQE